MRKSRAKTPLPLPLPLPAPEPVNGHAFEPRGAPCACSIWLRWFSLINPCNIYLFDRNRADAPIVRVYTVIRPRRKKHAFSGRRAGNYTKADPCL
jgi:hypothetical protein